MKHILIITTIVISLFSCKTGDKNAFKVSGKITNATGKMVYLEEVPIESMNPIIVDSAVLNSDGTFSIESETGESSIYNIRIDQSMYPVASIINDAASIELDIVMSKDNNQFPEKYEIKGSPASQSMKEFLFGVNDKLQNLFVQAKKIDSLHQLKTPDSVIAPMLQANAANAAAVKTYALEEIKKSKNPSLALYILGYYQSSTGNPALGLEPIANEQVNAIISDLIKNNPNHSGVLALQKELQSQSGIGGGQGMVGKQAPEFTLPDVSGKPVALSSFKGKYVLLDFWASWCKPCRIENPNVVEAYNKFKDKNFTVVGVSLDRAKEPWLKAIKDDGLTWPQLSDLQFWNSPVVPLYGFEGIPYNVLIDPQGKIIAEGLRGRFLESKLEEVLQ